MTIDLDAALAATPAAPESALGGTATPRSHRHQWLEYFDHDGATCAWCGKPKDEQRSRRGKSSARFGKVQERRIERVYGPRKVGEFGDAVDLLGRDWKWQSKATRTAPPIWLVSVDAPEAHAPSALVLGASEAMLPLAPHLFPLVIRSHVANGIGTRDWIWVRAADWTALHGDAQGSQWLPWVVMSGEAFLKINGRDEP